MNHELEQFQTWMDTTTAGKTMKALFYASLASMAYSFLCGLRAHQVDLFGAYAPYAAPGLTFLINLVRPSIKNY